MHVKVIASGRLDIIYDSVYCTVNSVAQMQSRVLRVHAQKREISLTHIESRPSKQDNEHYDFCIDCVAGDQIDAAISDLQTLSSNVTVLTRNVDATASETGPSQRLHYSSPLRLSTIKLRTSRCCNAGRRL